MEILFFSGIITKASVLLHRYLSYISVPRVHYTLHLLYVFLFFLPDKYVKVSLPNTSLEYNLKLIMIVSSVAQPSSIRTRNNEMAVTLFDPIEAFLFNLFLIANFWTKIFSKSSYEWNLGGESDFKHT